MAKVPFIVAHRGASHDAPENTLAAFRLGFEQNADAVELDIHLTRDGKIVVMHDPDTKRMCGVEMKIAEHTLEGLRQLKVAGRESIPTLEEALTLIPSDKKILIEIKCHCEVLPELWRVLDGSGLRADQTIIITFYGDVATAVKQQHPELYVQLLCGYQKETTADDLIARAKGLDALSLDQRFPIDAAFVSRIHAAGLGCYVWTVDDAQRARDVVAARVDGITSNRPGFIRAAISPQ